MPVPAVTAVTATVTGTAGWVSAGWNASERTSLYAILLLLLLLLRGRADACMTVSAECVAAAAAVTVRSRKWRRRLTPNQ